MDAFEFQMKIPDVQQTYTHQDTDGTMRMFMVGSMQLFIEDYPDCKLFKKITADITPDFVVWAREKQGIEQARLDRLCEPYISKPCIGILWDDGSLHVVDGNHRMVRLFELGRKTTEIYVFAPQLWPSFVLPKEEMEAVLRNTMRDPLKGYSGIIEAEEKYAGYASKCL
jgi:hypothetical protein